MAKPADRLYVGIAVNATIRWQNRLAFGDAMRPLTRSFAPLRTTLSPLRGARVLAFQFLRPAKRGEGAAKRRMRGGGAAAGAAAS